MFFAATFLPLGVLSLAMAAAPGDPILRLLWLNTGVACLGLGSGYAWLGPRVMFKKNDGIMPVVTYLIYWPYFVVSEFSFWAFKTLTKEAPCHEIAPGLFHGRRLSPGEDGLFETRRIKGVLDLTSEFAETRFMREVPAYLCLPLLDATAPTTEELEKGVAWIKENLTKGGVFVHCALGHGRSTTLVAAYLLSAGLTRGIDETLAFIKSKRPGAKLHGRQRRLLEKVFGGGRAL